MSDNSQINPAQINPAQINPAQINPAQPNPFEPNRGAAAVGWYPDGATPGVLRWWNGVSWTEHTQSVVAASPYPAAVYPPSAGYQTAQTPQVAPGTSPYTPFIWAIALLPVLSLIGFAAWDPSGFVDSIVAQSARSATTGSRLGANAAIYANLGPGYGITVAISWLSYAATVILAYFDFRRLGRRGYARRFHWAWSFLGPIVYLIGRSVVVRSQVGRGLAILWIYIGIEVLSVAIFTTRLIIAFVAAAPLMQR
ncbi:DUF2510 domain-containing protein [Subtercola endophyticus]|uniref:DUF2510 domain-containing protein n=1 Tax=Subtercola endophyticus TaxID=2895559 RepID=UPI001E5D9E10|nr:DUF2510 domain-containing protein [Subtercola endophyticus]UFS58523.1 DUF2510 domain-containing protein [Subtercola endophyticus]